MPTIKAARYNTVETAKRDGLAAHLRQWKREKPEDYANFRNVMMRHKLAGAAQLRDLWQRYTPKVTVVDGWTVAIIYSEDREGGYSFGWTIHPTALPLSDEAIRTAFRRFGIDTEPDHCQHSYDCCGHYYTGGLSITRENGLVSASVGYYQNV